METKKYSYRGKCNCISLRRAANAVTEYYDDMLAPSGLTVNQFSLLSHIRQMDLCSVSSLAEKMHLERTTLVRNLKPLIESGLVEDLSLPKQRTRQLRVTEAGIERCNAASPLWKQAQLGIRAHIGSEKLNDLTEILSLLEDI